LTVVVTGAAGFIGRSLVVALARRGHRVVGIDRLPGVPVEASTALVADLSRPSADADELLRGADAVFHLAGRPGVRDAAPDVERLRRRDNVEATRRLCDVVPPATPLVVTSSSSVYGGSRGAPSAEDGPVRPVGGYALSKVAAERLCARRAALGGAVAVARPFTVAGEGQRPDMALAGWLAAARQGRPLRILGSADRTRDMTDVRDVVDGLIRMADRGVASTINLGTGRGLRLDEMARAAAAAVGVPPVLAVEPAGPCEAPATLADTSRCERLLGFVPTTDLTDLLRRQAAAELVPLLEIA
jgi:nucleoside-diphosphate-sugar epimerase